VLHGGKMDTVAGRHEVDDGEERYNSVMRIEDVPTSTYTIYRRTTDRTFFSLMLALPAAAFF
jgi:hypothetical protein